jgi:hypothetical protein
VGSCKLDMAMPTRYDSEWTPAWLCHERTAPSWNMIVDMHGYIAMEAWPGPGMGADPWPHTVHGFLREWGLVSTHGQVSLWDLFGAAAQLPVLRSLHMHIGLHLALQIEKHLLGTSWPATFRLMPGSYGLWWAHLQLGVTAPSMYAVFTWEGIDSYECGWRSWYLHVNENEDIGCYWMAEIRIVTSSGIQPLIGTIAHSVWYLFDGATLQLLAGPLHYLLSDTTDEVHVLIHMTVEALRCTHEEAMMFNAHRLSQMSSTQFMLATCLLEIDEVSTCLTAGGEAAMKAAQETAKDTLRSHRTFKQLYKEQG